MAVSSQTLIEQMMSSADVLISRAWMQVTSYSDSKLRLTDLLALFNVLEDLVREKLLSDEYRDFLIEFVMECPQVEVNQEQFKALMERLFECSMEDILRGGLTNKSKSRFAAVDVPLHGADYENREDFTQTMNMESSKFNSFMLKGTLREKEDILRGRIRELESMLTRSKTHNTRDSRTVNKMRDLLLEYYKSLDKITVSKSASSVPETGPMQGIVQRLKDGIDKQNVLINELKRKVGDDQPKSVFGQVRFRIVHIYMLVWRIVRLPLYIVLLLLVLNFLLYVFYDDGYAENPDVALAEEYWDSAAHVGSVNY